MGIKHAFNSAVSDAADASRVRPSNWNADHTIDGDVDFNGHAIVNATGVGSFLSLSDTDDTTFTNKVQATVQVNLAETGLQIRYSTAEYEDVRDYLSGGPRELIGGEDITSAVQAMVDAQTTHKKIKFRIPAITGGSGGTAIEFDPESVTGISGTGINPYQWLLETFAINLKSTWILGEGGTIRGITHGVGGVQFMKGPALRSRITNTGAGILGAWTGLASVVASPLIQMSQRNCQIETIKVEAGSGASCAIKVGFDSQRLWRLHLSCSTTAASGGKGALWVNDMFWLNMDYIFCGYTGAAGAREYAMTIEDSGLVRGLDITLANGGILFTATSPDLTNNVVLDEVISENQSADQSLLNFDSSAGPVGGIKIRQPGMADMANPAYVLYNTGSATTAITLEGSHRQASTNKELYDPASPSTIRGLFLDEAAMGLGIDLNTGILQPYFGAGQGLAYGIPRTDTQTGTSAKLYCAPPGAQWNLGTILPVDQNPANWVTVSGGAAVTTGIRGPDGSTNAGTIADVVGTGTMRCMNLITFNPAVGDFILMGCWVKGAIGSKSTSDCALGLQMTAAGWTLSGSASATIPPSTSGFPLPALDPFYNIDDNGWQYVTFLYKFSAVTGGAGTLRFTLYDGASYCYPCAMHIPTSAGMDEPTLLYHMNRLTNSVGGALSTAAVAGDVVFPDATAVMAGTFKAAARTFAQLPATPVAGMQAYITNSNTATWGATAAGGGANNVMVWYNGTNWTVMGA